MAAARARYRARLTVLWIDAHPDLCKLGQREYIEDVCIRWHGVEDVERALDDVTGPVSEHHGARAVRGCRRRQRGGRDSPGGRRASPLIMVMTVVPNGVG